MKLRKTTPIITLTLACLLITEPAMAIIGRIDIPELSKRSDAKTPVTVYNKDGRPVGQALFYEKPFGWHFDFPERNEEYTVKWPGGETTVVSPRVTNAEMYNYGGAALAATVGAALAVSLGGYDDDSSLPATPGSLVPTCDQLVGSYDTSGPKTSDSCGVEETDYIQTTTINCVAGSITMVVTRWFDTMTGSYDEDDGSLMAMGATAEENYTLSLDATAEKETTEEDSQISVTGDLTIEQEDGCQTVYRVTYTKL